MALADILVSAWYDGGRVPWWCWPLTGLYRGVTTLRRALYRRGVLTVQQLPVPVVVIGNITAGGTGKTPLTLAVVRALRERGFHPGVVSRGYGGRQREPLLLSTGNTPAEVGDEPCLIHGYGIPVAVGRDRPAAARLLVDAGCNVVVADDGLQHYRLGRDIEICVIDGERRFGNGHLLPAGPLREPMSRLDDVDFRICNGGLPAANEYAMQLLGGEALPLQGGDAQPVVDFASQPVHAVAAIGNPARFFDSLRSAGLQVIEHAFADHHPFTADDLAFDDDLPVLMTDKDAIKVHDFAREHWWRVPVRAGLPDEFRDALVHTLERLHTPTAAS